MSEREESRRGLLRAESYAAVDRFVELLDRLSGTQSFQDEYKKIPERYRRGRTFREMALDDLMEVFSFLMLDVPEREIPKDYFANLFSLREPHLKVTKAEAREAMNARIEQMRGLIDSGGGIEATPRFLTSMFKNMTIPMQQNMMSSWLTMMQHMYMLTVTEGGLSASERMGTLATTFNMIAQNALAQQQLTMDQPEEEKKLGAANDTGPKTGNIDQRTRDAVQKEQEAYILRKKMGEIKKRLAELGELSDDKPAQLRKKLYDAGLPPEAMETAERELERLEQTNPQSSDYGVILNYLGTLASLPWKKEPFAPVEMNGAQEILDEDHYGMNKVKDAIIGHLAVQQRTGSLNGKIICLVGPPGVGKTSIARSIARATNRPYGRLALGGVRDEAEIRGHRRTYVGAMPGSVIKAIKKAGSSNALMVLDEIDKLGSDAFRGDPTAAMLEVLDPEQNGTYRDHYLDLDFDLSGVMFITTANELGNIPGPLRDRMQVIQLPGYTLEEKIQIAKRHLVPKQMKAASLTEGEFSISDDALAKLIDGYTHEAGVRNLEREIGRLCTEAVKGISKGKYASMHITGESLATVAGVQKYSGEEARAEDTVGVVDGLAWTPFGGCMLPIEAIKLPGKSFSLKATGKLGDVMKESVSIAQDLVASLASRMGIQQETLDSLKISLHAPEGAIPKDGPSAGITAVTAIVSAVTDVPVRRDIAMTGEITLHGDVLPIGGLPEKLEAALKAGKKTVLIPAKNVKDLAEVSDKVKAGLEIIPVDKIDQVLSHALTRDVFAPMPCEEPCGEVIRPPAESWLRRKANQVFGVLTGNDNLPGPDQPLVTGTGGCRGVIPQYAALRRG